MRLPLKLYDSRGLQWLRELPRGQRILIVAVMVTAPPLLLYLVGRLGRVGQVGPLVLMLVLALLIGTSVALAIVGSELRRKSELQRDHLAAATIQQYFNPSQLPDVAGYDFAGACRTFMGIGGDYFDVIRFDEDRLLLVIADVSGKGTAAALTMASVHAVLQTQVDARRNVPQIAARLNTYLCRHTSPERYVTMVFGILHVPSGEFEYLNAGHNPPLLFSDGAVTRLDSCGPPFGLLESPEYCPATITLPPGSCLLLYTDGVPDRENPDGEQFGEERIVEAASPKPKNTPALEVLKKVASANNTFAKGVARNDDSTALVVRRVA